MRHYYAFYHTCGINATSASTGLPIGTLYRFASKSERQNWLDGEEYEGGTVHRAGIDAKLARKLLERSFRLADPWCIDAVLGRGASCEMSYWRKAATIDQLWDICSEGRSHA